MTVLKMYRICPDVKLPSFATKQASCFDLFFYGKNKKAIKGFTQHNKPIDRSYYGNQFSIAPGERVLIPTGLIMDIPEGFSVRLHARSGLSLKSGLVLANAEGVIDSDYTEETFVMLYNISGNSVTINEGDRIAQGELIKDEQYTIEATPVRPIAKTDRMGGFGSTGVSSITTITNDQEVVVINIPDALKEKKQELQPTVKRGRGRPRKNATSPS